VKQHILSALNREFEAFDEKDEVEKHHASFAEAANGQTARHGPTQVLAFTGAQNPDRLHYER
jgi:hypothetical protein